MINKLRLLLAVLLFPAAAFASNPYIQGLWTRENPIYFAQGVTAMPSTLSYDRTFTNIAILYHPLSAGSLIPERFQAYLPPESWACTIGGSYAPAANTGSLGVGAGFGCGVNLLDSVRGWAANLLQATGNDTLHNLGTQIAPGPGPANLFVSRQWDDTLAHPGIFAPRWFFGAGFEF